MADLHAPPRPPTGVVPHADARGDLVYDARGPRGEQRRWRRRGGRLLSFVEYPPQGRLLQRLARKQEPWLWCWEVRDGR